MNLRFILLALALLVLPVGAHEVNLEAFSQALGKPVIHDNRTNLIVAINEMVWLQVNTARKFNGRKRLDLAEVNSIPWINREYLDDALVLLEADYIDSNHRKPTEEELFYAWSLGLKALKKAKWDLTKLRNKDLELRWRLYVSVATKQRLLTIPNPLPTDGRQPLPTRNKKKGEGG